MPALAQSPPAQRAIAPETRQITDAAGRIVTIPSQVNRVADPWPANNAMVLMLGSADKLAATSLQARKQPWLRRLYPRIARVPAAFDAAGDVNVETLIGAQPDVILMAYGAPCRAGGRGRRLPRSGGHDAQRLAARLEDHGAHDRRGARRTRVEGRGGVYSLLRRQHPQSHAGHGQIAASERPKVLHTATPGILVVDGRQSVIDDWINVAGGVNAADVVGLGRPVTMEQVAAWNPDVIIVGTAPNQQNRQAILDDPRWRQIKAVREGKVYANPSGAISGRHSAEAALQVLWAAKLLHPALFADLDVRLETSGSTRSSSTVHSPTLNWPRS